MENKQSYILPIGALVLGYMVLSRFGLIDTGKSLKQAADAQTLTFDTDISPAYIKKLKRQEMQRRGLQRARFSEQRLTPDQVKRYGEAIRKTRGGIRPDDEAGLYSILRRIKYRTALAQVDAYFFGTYQKDLPQFWRTYLNNEELSEVYGIIQKMESGLRFIS